MNQINMYMIELQTSSLIRYHLQALVSYTVPTVNLLKDNKIVISHGNLPESIT